MTGRTGRERGATGTAIQHDDPHGDPGSDVLVIGGGLSGMSMALALEATGFSATIIDPVPASVQTAAGHDGRTTAISQASKRMLERLGVWEALPEPACPISDIRVREGHSPLFLQFDRDDAGAEAMGHIVDNGALKAALYQCAGKHGRTAGHEHGRGHIRILSPALVSGLESRPGHIIARLADGGTVTAQLAVAADGRRSPTRRRAGIRTTDFSYGQSAVTCTVSHTRPHDFIAYEHFLPAGPFAMLPLMDGTDGTHRSCLVWSIATATAAAFDSLGDAEFDAEMQTAFGDSLGRLHVAGKRRTYPLGLVHAERYIGPRLVLIGDAAHGMHPIAGQGFNVGLRDIAGLVDTLGEARRLGLDFAAAPVLEKYQRKRRFDVMSMLAATDGLNRLFSNDSAMAALARDLGLGLVQRIGPLKRGFMRAAMGTMGDLPKLMRAP